MANIHGHHHIHTGSGGGGGWVGGWVGGRGATAMVRSREDEKIVFPSRLTVTASTQLVCASIKTRRFPVRMSHTHTCCEFVLKPNCDQGFCFGNIRPMAHSSPVSKAAAIKKATDAARIRRPLSVRCRVGRAHGLVPRAAHKPQAIRHHGNTQHLVAQYSVCGQ